MPRHPRGKNLKLSFEPKIASIIEAVSRVAGEHGVPCFLVGGCVRDAMLQRPVLDLDVLIDAANQAAITAEEFAEIASQALHGSRPVCFDRFGTFHFVVGGKEDRIELEVVGAALDVSDDFEIANVSDILRRDFTVNTLLSGLNDGNLGRLYDLTGSGAADIKRRILRCPKEPAVTLADDPIRMLRAVRLSCTLGFGIDDSVGKFIRENPTLINEAAVERVRKELELILLCDTPAGGFEMLHELNLLGVIMPELEALSGVMQDKRFHSQDVLHHTFSVLSHVEQRDLAMRLGALFHDAGKRQAKMQKETRVVFYGHEHISAVIATQRLYALRFPNRLIKEVGSLVRNHMINYSGEWTDAAIRRLIKRLGSSLPKQLDLYEADIRALRDSGELLDAAYQLRKRIETIDEKEHVAKVESPLNGHEICELLGIKPGPLVGKYKAKLLDAVLSGELRHDKAAASGYLLRLWKVDGSPAEALTEEA